MPNREVAEYIEHMAEDLSYDLDVFFFFLTQDIDLLVKMIAQINVTVLELPGLEPREIDPNTSFYAQILNNSLPQEDISNLLLNFRTFGGVDICKALRLFISYRRFQEVYFQLLDITSLNELLNNISIENLKRVGLDIRAINKNKPYIEMD